MAAADADTLPDVYMSTACCDAGVNPDRVPWRKMRSGVIWEKVMPPTSAPEEEKTCMDQYIGPTQVNTCGHAHVA